MPRRRWTRSCASSKPGARSSASRSRPRADADNLPAIRAEMARRRIAVPLVADIHFTPAVALRAVEHVEKIRINPGNYADKKKFAVREYTDAEYEAELERIARVFSSARPAREGARRRRCASARTTARLSDRIMNRYGDTPEGMVESALEFVRICERRRLPRADPVDEGVEPGRGASTSTGCSSERMAPARHGLPVSPRRDRGRRRRGRAHQVGARHRRAPGRGHRRHGPRVPDRGSGGRDPGRPRAGRAVQPAAAGHGGGAVRARPRAADAGGRGARPVPACAAAAPRCGASGRIRSAASTSCGSRCRSSRRSATRQDCAASSTARPACGSRRRHGPSSCRSMREARAPEAVGRLRRSMELVAPRVASRRAGRGVRDRDVLETQSSTPGSRRRTASTSRSRRSRMRPTRAAALRSIDRAKRADRALLLEVAPPGADVERAVDLALAAAARDAGQDRSLLLALDAAAGRLAAPRLPAARRAPRRRAARPAARAPRRPAGPRGGPAARPVDRPRRAPVRRDRRLRSTDRRLGGRGCAAPRVRHPAGRARADHAHRVHLVPVVRPHAVRPRGDDRAHQALAPPT